jgi:regulatory protein
LVGTRRAHPSDTGAVDSGDVFGPTDAGRAKGPKGTAKDRALRLLGVRWRSREELRRRLKQAGFEPEEIEGALENLMGAGLVDDERFAAEVVRVQSGRRGSGDRAIRSALAAKGVAPETAAAAMAGLGDEAERALELAIGRASRFSGLPPEAAFRRLHGLLVRRGYSPGVARDACRAALADLPAGVEEPGPP